MNKGFQFNPEINTGHILVCLTIAVSSIGVFFTLKGDVSSLKDTVRKIEVKVDSMEDKVNSVYYKSK